MDDWWHTHAAVPGMFATDEFNATTLRVAANRGALQATKNSDRRSDSAAPNVLPVGNCRKLIGVGQPMRGARGRNTL